MRDSSKFMLVRLLPVALITLAAAAWFNDVQGGGPWVLRNLLPLLVLLLVWALPNFDPKLQFSAILLAAMPMMTIYPVIGAHYGYRNFCAGTLLATTTLSFFSISAILLVIG